VAGPLRLITIGFSHFCEKARWALDRSALNYREEDHVPLFHWRATLAAGGRTVPMLVTPGRVLRDSTEILRFVDEHLSAGQRLFPEEPELRAEVTQLTAEFDRGLGPAVRRWLYFHVLTARPVAAELICSTGTAWERSAARRVLPVLRAMIGRGLKIDPASAERSRQRFQSSFDAVEARLADGRQYLVGDRFTAADLTFAALAGALTQPAGYGFPAAGGGQIAAIAAAVTAARASAAGRFIQRLYDEERPVSRGGLGC
jgi:glutathione S-transferase